MPTARLRSTKQSRGKRQPSTSGHALAIARWEPNDKGWFQGKDFILTSKATDLQDLIGSGGTLWIVVSRQVHGKRLYSLTFRLENCRKYNHRKGGGFGKYSVIGDPSRSTLYASNDARLLLLSLRFDPFRPIDHRCDRLRVIGNSIQRPRSLSTADVKLLEHFATGVDRWSVFLSYENVDVSIATRLSKMLQREGISVFRDRETLRAGEKWWPAIQKAIGRARLMVVVIGKTTRVSKWVKREIEEALHKKIGIVPVIAGGNLDEWRDFQLHRWQALTYSHSGSSEVVGRIARALHRPA